MIDFAHVEPLVRAVLYEGYVLYPYRASSVKNRQRWTFGGLYPRAWSERGEGDPWWLRAEVLVLGGDATRIGGALRFLEVAPRAEGDDARGEPQSAVERRVEIAPRPIPAWLSGAPAQRFAFGPMVGEVEATAERVGLDLVRARVTVRNLTPLPHPSSCDRAPAMDRSFASAHVLLGVEGALGELAEIVSLTDPPAHLASAADGCANVGVWPILAGPPGRRDTALASPIILEDHPRIAPESPGDLFDATEIDEILTLRILTLTEAEQAEVRATDPRAAAILDRTLALGDEALRALHGAMRAEREDPARNGGVLTRGARVVLRPRGGADAFDVVLAGRAATVASIERDVEGRTFVAVTVDDDPGRDLGRAGQPGHRFFFRDDEVEVVT
jgi:hypothetical protein